MKAPRHGTRRWRRRVLLLAIATLVALALLEVGMHVLDVRRPIARDWPGDHSDRTHPHFERDALVGWRMRAGIEFTHHDEGVTTRYRADANGLRTGDGAPPPNAPIIVLAGDSFVWGASVEHPATLAGRLADHYRAHVVNLAQPGFGIDQIVLAATKQGLPRQPKLLVVGIYPQDLLRSHTAYRTDFGLNKPTFRLDGNTLVALTSQDAPSWFGRWLENDCRLFGLWRSAERNLGTQYGFGGYWRLNAALLDDLVSEAKRAEVPLLIVHVPMHSWQPLPALTDWCRQRAVALVDPTTAHAEKPVGTYFEPAGHFTPVGHRMLADLVIAWIDRSGIARLR